MRALEIIRYVNSYSKNEAKLLLADFQEQIFTLKFEEKLTVQKTLVIFLISA